MLVGGEISWDVGGTVMPFLAAQNHLMRHCPHLWWSGGGGGGGLRLESGQDGSGKRQVTGTSPVPENNEAKAGLKGCTKRGEKLCGPERVKPWGLFGKMPRKCLHLRP